MELRIEVSDTAPGVRAVRLAGELDLDVYDAVSQALQRAERADPVPATLVVDLRGLAFMDSTGGRLLAEAHHRALREGRRLAVVPGSGQPGRVIDLLRLEGHVELVAEPDDVIGGNAAPGTA